MATRRKVQPSKKASKARGEDFYVEKGFLRATRPVVWSPPEPAKPQKTANKVAAQSVDPLVLEIASGARTVRVVGVDENPRAAVKPEPRRLDVAPLRRALEVLANNDGDAAVVARAALSFLVDRETTIVDSKIMRRAELGDRLHSARVAIEGREAATAHQRRCIIEDVQAAAALPSDSSVEILLHLLRDRDARFAKLTHEPTAFLMNLRRRLARKNVSAWRVAADLAKRAGVESGNALESYRQARPETSNRAKRKPRNR